MIHPTAIIYPNVTIGKNVYVGAYCIIGAPAEHKKYWNEENDFGVVIGDNTIIHGHATIDAGTIQDTRIGEDCFIMKAVHLGHDVELKNGVTIAPHAVIGGHVVIGEKTNIGIAAAIHQRVSIPSGCMIGMNSTITKSTSMDIDRVYIGSPARFLRWNKR